jgi:hypothetical protein
VDTPLGLRVHCTEAQWNLIATTKRPPMRGRIDPVKATLEDPDGSVAASATLTCYCSTDAPTRGGAVRWPDAPAAPDS